MLAWPEQTSDLSEGVQYSEKVTACRGCPQSSKTTQSRRKADIHNGVCVSKFAGYDVTLIRLHHTTMYRN